MFQHDCKSGFTLPKSKLTPCSLLCRPVPDSAHVRRCPSSSSLPSYPQIYTISSRSHTAVLRSQVDSVDLTIRPVSYIISGSHPLLKSTVIETVSPRLKPRLPGQQAPFQPTPAAAAQAANGEDDDSDFGNFEEAVQPPQPDGEQLDYIQETAGEAPTSNASWEPQYGRSSAAICSNQLGFLFLRCCSPVPCICILCTCRRSSLIVQFMEAINSRHGHGHLSGTRIPTLLGSILDFEWGICILEL